MASEKAIKPIAVCGAILIPNQTKLGKRPSPWPSMARMAIKIISRHSNVAIIVRLPWGGMPNNNDKLANKKAVLVTGEIGWLRAGGSLSNTTNQSVALRLNPAKSSRVKTAIASKTRQQLSNSVCSEYVKEINPKPQAINPMAVLYAMSVA